MAFLEDVRVWQHLVGDVRTRSILAAAVAGLFVLSSGGFVLGMDVGLSLDWVVVALGIAFVAGLVGAGLGPTIGSLWAIGLWWFVFPPLVGHLGGGWVGASRYNHPRMLGYAYTSSRAELIGGLEHGVPFGLLFAIVGGSIAYVAGAVIPWLATRSRAHRRRFHQ